MAIAGQTPGTYSGGGTTSLTVPYPATVAAGDLLVLHIANKYPTNGPSLPSGWTAPANGQASGGHGANGLDAGSIYSTIFVKVADGTETGSLTVTITSGNSSSARMLRYTKDAAKTWSWACVTGAVNTPNQTWSVTAAAGLDVTAGDMVVVGSAINTDTYTWTLEAIAQTGVTFGAMVERNDNATSAGQDHGIVATEHPVSSGTGSVAPTYTMTASAAAGTDIPAGATVFLRLREVTPAIVGSAAITEAADTGACAGTLALTGATAMAETADTVASTGVLPIVGSASISEAADTVASTGILPIAGAASLTEAADTAAGTGVLPIVGSAALTEAADTTAATGALALVGIAAITEAADTLVAAGTGAAIITGAAALTEAPDTVAAMGALPIGALASVVEASDSLLAVAGLEIRAVLVNTEAADTLAATGEGVVPHTGVAALLEAADSLLATSAIVITGVLAITEAGDMLTAYQTATTPAVRRAFRAHSKGAVFNAGDEQRVIPVRVSSRTYRARRH